MENEKKHYCFNCRKYDAFYTKEETRYKITTDGYCSEKGKKKPTADEVGVAYDNLKRIEELLMNLHIIWNRLHK